MVICLDKDTLSYVTCRRKIERALWVIWIELDISGEFCDVGLSCIIYTTRKSGLPVRDPIFENFQKSNYRPRFLIWFLGITHERVSLEKLRAIRKNWSFPEILDGTYRKSLLTALMNQGGIETRFLPWELYSRGKCSPTSRLSSKLHALNCSNEKWRACMQHVG